jgi:hypothetical protein
MLTGALGTSYEVAAEFNAIVAESYGGGMPETFPLAEQLGTRVTLSR